MKEEIKLNINVDNAMYKRAEEKTIDRVFKILKELQKDIEKEKKDILGLSWLGIYAGIGMSFEEIKDKMHGSIE